MAKKSKKTSEPSMPQMPFDDALRKILSAPHQPMRKKSKRALSKRTK